MKHKKSLQELTIKDNFMFGAVAIDPENCKGILERSLGVELERVEVSKERSIVYNPEYKGIRLDAYAKDESNTRYNIEMQILKKPALKKRARYYHSQIDMELLLSGISYEELPDTYVIFICDFDPFGKKRYKYTCKKVCKEVPELEMEDGTHIIFLSTKGINGHDESKALVNFLTFVGLNRVESEKDFEDEFVRRLQKTIRDIKKSREMGARYMTFQELLKDERAEGRVEDRRQVIIEFLEELGDISKQLHRRIEQENDIHVLKLWSKLAARSETIEQFEDMIDNKQ